jgi:glycosyltransferase involved in cell wall biosynthesis
MKICLVKLGALPALSPEYKQLRIGGEEVQHAQLAAALKRAGYDVTLVVADCGQADGAIYGDLRTLKAYDESAGVPVLRFVHPRWTGLWSAIKRANADIYYCSSAGMLVGMLAMYCRLHRRRLVFRTASDSDCDPKNFLIRFRRDRWLYEYGLRRADAVLVQTATQQRMLMQNYGLHGTIADMLVARPAASAMSAVKDIDVLWISNLRHIKRPDRVLEIARAMPQYRFHMAGGPAGEEDLFRQVEIDVREIANLTFHGAVPYLDVGTLFDRARVLANTSDLEGFPNTFLQAWVRGIPVVTMFDPDGVVRSKGLGSSHSTVPEMVTGLDALLRSELMYRRASSSATEFMAKRFNEAQVLAPYLAAIAGPTRPQYETAERAPAR